MAKKVGEWSYLAGLACAVIALVWRGLAALGLGHVEFTFRGGVVGTITLYKAALLLLVMAVASANYLWSQSQK